MVAERTTTRVRICFQIAFWIPLAACTWFALMPDPPDNPVFRLSDIVLHATAFIYLSLSLILAQLHGLRAPAYLRTLFFMFGYGVLLEVIQSFIPERSAELKDLLVDVVGIGIGLLLARWLARPVYEQALRWSARI